MPESDISIHEGVNRSRSKQRRKLFDYHLVPHRIPILTDRAVEAVKEYTKAIAAGEKAELEDFQNLLSQKIGSPRTRVIDSDAAKVLLKTAETMAGLITAKKDTVWAFILKNIYKQASLPE